MKRILAAALFCAMGFTACDTTTGTAENLVPNSVLLDTLDNHGNIDSSLSYTKNGDNVGLVLNGNPVTINMADPRSWTTSFTIDTAVQGIPLTVPVTLGIFSTHIVGSSTCENAVYRADSLRLQVSSPFYTIDTTLVLSGDTAFYWLMLPLSNTLYLSGNTKLVTDIQATLASLLMGGNPPKISDAELIDTLDNHGPIDSTRTFTKNENNLSLTLSGYPLSFDVSNPAVWSTTFIVDTLGMSVPITISQNSTKIIGDTAFEQAVYRVTSQTLSITIGSGFMAVTRDTTVELAPDSTCYWLVFPTSDKLYLSGNTSILDNIKSTMFSLVNKILNP